MDMKKILQAMDGANPKAEVHSSDIKKFLTIVEGKGPLNRPTAAEAITMQHYTAPKKTITAPVLNVQEDAKPSMIGKYFKAVEQEIAETADRSKDRARHLAERVIERVTPNADGSLPDPSINRLTGKPNPPAAEPAPAPAASGPTVEYGGSTYNVMVFGDGVRPRIARSDKVVGAKVYTVGNKMYVLLDAPAQEGVAEGSQKWYPDAPVNDYAGHEYHKLSDTELERKRADQKERHEKLGDTKAGKNAAIARGIQVHRVRQGVAEGSEDLVQIEYWQQETMESGRWVKTKPIPRATAEKIVNSFERGEIVDVEQGVAEDKDPCWDSHKMVGTKKKGGKTVPNCVPKESVQKKGPAGQLKGTDKVDVKGTVLGSKEKSQKGLRGKLVGGST